MVLKISAKQLSRKVLLAAVLATASVAAVGFSASDVTAAPKKKQSVVVASRDGRGVNYSYQSGPRTRVFITRRSWLDGGTEVLPGERKFTDYAYAPGYNYGRNIDRVNQGRNPLSNNFDLGGGPTGFPLPPY